ncbi:MAG TPA: AAA family ATPase [Candidatus Acidoferrales bacterium]|nr:AAA family ATPase [Candidatus Acidoferrales bacterium]
MLLEHFGLIEQPFGVTPDPRFLHFGASHREALASLLVGTEANRGFLALIAPPGMGKTSLLFHFLESLRNRARTAFLFQAAADPRELMRYLLADLGLDASGKDLPGMHEMLNQVLLEEMRAGRRLILVIDEAQNFDDRVLESVRLLSNFETPWMKLMQIVIAGQPQLAERLARPSMAQLRQRISSFIRLAPFTPPETDAYVGHRLWIAGYSGPRLFTVGALLLIAEHSGGIPRNINNLCFQSMTLACAVGKKQVDSSMVREAISDLAIESPAREVRIPQFAGPPKNSRKTFPAIASLAAVLLLSVLTAVSWKTNASGSATPRGPEPIDTQAATDPAASGLERDLTPLADPNTASTVEAVQAPDPVAADPAFPTLTVVVEKGATLRHLSLLYLDRFDLSTLLEICSLNPAISNPDHIETGQRLRMPMYLRRDPSMEAPDSSLEARP